jgi:AraC-like DNA-binding protein
MMDESEHDFLDHIPAQSMSLRLARATIKMDHAPDWRVDKVNPVHDLIVCLSGQGKYRFLDKNGADTVVVMEPGHAMLIPAFTRFQGTHGGGTTAFTGIAQHFSLDLFDKGDMVRQLSFQRMVALPNWTILRPLVEHFRATANHGGTTLAQHHQFMVILLAYLGTAATGWAAASDMPDPQDHLSVQIMRVAARLSADPLGSGVEEALADVPYNPDYFRRAFRDRFGHTPQKFRELKRMEFAANRLGMGLTVKTVAAELGYADPYFFSRMFKKYLGTSPSSYRSIPGKTVFVA